MMGGAASDPADLGSGMEWHGMAEQRLVTRTTRPHTAEKGWLSTPPTSRLRGGWFLRWASDKPLNEAGGDEMPQMQIFSIAVLRNLMIVNVQAPARGRFGLARQRNSSIEHRKRPLLATCITGPFGNKMLKSGPRSAVIVVSHIRILFACIGHGPPLVPCSSRCIGSEQSHRSACCLDSHTKAAAALWLIVASTEVREHEKRQPCRQKRFEAAGINATLPRGVCAHLLPCSPMAMTSTWLAILNGTPKRKPGGPNCRQSSATRGASEFQVPSPTPSNGGGSRSLDWRAASSVARATAWADTPLLSS
ncbi:hypothetical protein MRS44_007309 [Fusarium solani]|uniref:uncharacterized protein n=1 Tax=Fusarium solani TaxID=169388 RepID=UPI0032C4419D|nr:hypothetical protein MRS44_007309 [Fusarium solani]